ncbi:MAG: DUF5979 domain-containing protein [Bilifractor sp.]
MRKKIITIMAGLLALGLSAVPASASESIRGSTVHFDPAEAVGTASISAKDIVVSTASISAKDEAVGTAPISAEDIAVSTASVNAEDSGKKESYDPEDGAYHSVFTDGKQGTLTIEYRVGTDGDDPVAGAAFTLYKLADITSMSADDEGPGTGYRSIIPGLTIREDVNGNPVADLYTRITVDTDPEKFRDIMQMAYRDKDFVNLSDEEKKTTPGRVYTGVTDSSGMLKIEQIEPAAYLLVETKPADHYYASVPALVSIPEMAVTEKNGKQGWNYDVLIRPKAIPAGDLLISKTVKGNAAEKNRAFHFTIKIMSADNDKTTESARPGVKRKVYLDPEELTYRYENSNGTSGTVKSGGMVSIRPGEQVRIMDIPSGASYLVKEEEADQDGYQTSAEHSSGNISRKDAARTEFINARDRNPNVQTGDQIRKYLIAAAGMAVSVFLLLAVSRKRKGGADGK